MDAGAPPACIYAFWIYLCIYMSKIYTDFFQRNGSGEKCAFCTGVFDLLSDLDKSKDLQVMAIKKFCETLFIEYKIYEHYMY